MSWLQGGWFVAVSGFSHVRESKQYYRTSWSPDYLQQGHIDPNIVFCYHFYFLWAFFRCDLDYKMLQFVPPLVCDFPPEACTGGHNYIGWKTNKGQMLQGGGSASQALSRVLCPLSTKYQLKFHGSRQHLVQCITQTLNATAFLFTYTCWGRGLGGFEGKIILETHSGSLLPAVKNSG